MSQSIAFQCGVAFLGTAALLALRSRGKRQSSAPTKVPSQSDERRPQAVHGLEMFSLRGRVALVTGGGSGLGRACALALASVGCKVIVVGRRRKQLEETCQMNEAGCGDIVPLCGDLTDLGAMRDLAAESKRLGGKGAIDILLNCAGMNPRLSAEAISIETWDKTLRLNASAPFFLARECVAEMRDQQWGRIINIASLQSRLAFRNGVAYGAAKGGLAQITRAMAEAWGSSGICANTVSPGFYKTELTERVFDAKDGVAAGLAARTAAGRNGVPDDLAGTIIFLASRASDYVNGQNIFVDGGFTAMGLTCNSKA